MCSTANSKLGETVEHSVSSVLEASVSGVVLPRTTHVCCAHVVGQKVFDRPGVAGAVLETALSLIK